MTAKQRFLHCGAMRELPFCLSRQMRFPRCSSFLAPPCAAHESVSLPTPARLSNFLCPVNSFDQIFIYISTNAYSHSCYFFYLWRRLFCRLVNQVIFIIHTTKTTKHSQNLGVSNASLQSPMSFPLMNHH